MNFLSLPTSTSNTHWNPNLKMSATAANVASAAAGLHHGGGQHLPAYHQITMQTFKQSGSPEPIRDRTPGRKKANLEIKTWQFIANVSIDGLPQSTSSVSDGESCSTVKDENGQDIVCVVCGDKSSGKHYGQYTCEGTTIFHLLASKN